MKGKAAVFSVIFPGNLPFFGAYLGSLVAQTEQDFDVLLVVDGVVDIQEYLSPFRDRLHISTTSASGTIAEVRAVGLGWLEELTYDHIVFADTDDKLSPDRVAVCRQYLESYPVVVNDLLPFTDLEPTGRGYWENRMADRTEFSGASIERFNFAGLGNSAVRREVLDRLAIPKALKAVDWFLFHHWLQHRTGIFTHAGKALYRQHGANMIGLHNFTEEKLWNILRTKGEHYEVLQEASPHLRLLWEKNVKLAEALKTDADALKRGLRKIQIMDKNFFWWEETEYLL